MTDTKTLQRYLEILALKGMYEEALDLDSAEPFIELVATTGLNLAFRGERASGQELLLRAATRYPESALLQHAAGTALSVAGNYDGALSHHQQAVALSPDEPVFLYNLAFALESCSRHAEAGNSYRTAWVLDRAYAKAAMGYARTLTTRQHYWQAVRVLREALRYSAEQTELLVDLANALIFAGEAERALLYYRAALETLPNDRKLAANFLYALLMVREIAPAVIAEELECWAGVQPLLRVVAGAAGQLNPLDPVRVFAYHREAGDRIESHNRADSASVVITVPMSRRLRIGYISSDLYNHPMGYLMQGVLPNHDRSRFEVIVFSPFSERDGLTAFLKQAVEHWILLNPVDRGRSVELVRGAQPDILVELSGHTGDNWLDLCARRLAPLQLTWGGYPSTTGLSTIDYIIADSVSLPLEDVPYYTEKPLRIPRGYACFIPPDGLPLPGSLPCLSSGQLTFGSFLTLHKLTSTTVLLWSRVLQAVPDARLYLKARALSDPEVVREVLEKFAGQGVDPGRITVAAGSPRLAMMEEYGRIDIVLDPVPYQGGVTILEAAWMGVPTLLLRGSRPPFVRHGENYLVQLGMQDWIAVSEDDYIAKAVHWNHHLPQLSAIRHRLRQQMAVSPLCDTVGFTRDLEVAYERAWYGLTEEQNSR